MTMMTILVMKIFIMKFYFQRTVFVGVGNGLIHGHTIHLGKKPVQLKKRSCKSKLRFTTIQSYLHVI